MRITFNDEHPEVDETAFVAPNATLIGRVTIAKKASIWFGAVLRGDSDSITIGKRTNIQDNAVIHVDPGYPVSIGDDSIVGHLALVHGATVGNNVLVGMNSTILNGATIGDYSIIGANALVTSNTSIPPKSLVLGSPAKVVRTLKPEELRKIEKNAEAYVKLTNAYLELDLD